MKPILSILICTVPKRRDKLEKLWNELDRQVSELKTKDKSVELLCFCDNKVRTIGEKRQSLLDISRGEYIAYVDDDDWISPDYIEQIYSTLVFEWTQSEPSHLVVFPIKVTINGEQEGIVEPSIKYANYGSLNEYKPPVTYRPPHELCVWRSDIAKRGRFPATSKDEDFSWAKQCWPYVKSEKRIDKVLYHWISNSELWEEGHQ